MKLPSMTRDLFKYKQAILFEVGRIGLEYIKEKLPLRHVCHSLGSACYVLSNFFHFGRCASFYLPEYYFFPFPTIHRGNFLRFIVLFCFVFSISLENEKFLSLMEHLFMKTTQ